MPFHLCQSVRIGVAVTGVQETEGAPLSSPVTGQIIYMIVTVNYKLMIIRKVDYLTFWKHLQQFERYYKGLVEAEGRLLIYY